MKEKEISKLYNSITNVNNQFIEETQVKTKKNNVWLKWAAMAACMCLMICVFAIPYLFEQTNDNATGELSPMVYVNNTLYQSANSQLDITSKEDQFVYLGVISSKVSSSQYPKENFQANDDIVGSMVYQYGADVVVESNGQYWLYCAVLDVDYTMLDVDYTINDDGTYTCRGNTYKYKIDIFGIDGETQVTYIVLTNNMETSFEDVSYSLKTAEISTDIPEFVILGWYY